MDAGSETRFQDAICESSGAEVTGIDPDLPPGHECQVRVRSYR
jgi:hypothetical protein